MKHARVIYQGVAQHAAGGPESRDLRHVLAAEAALAYLKNK